MTFTQLEYIIALDTYRNFVLAAEKCFVTQPTLSMQIQKLEDTLGAKLFDRSKQPVVPTEMGVEVIRKARLILNESQKIKELISDRKGELEGELKIGVIPTVAPYLLPKVIVNFMENYPKVKLLVWEYTTEQIIHDLKNGVLDCGVLSTPTDDHTLKEIPLFYENFVAYISPDNPLLKKKNLNAADINPDDLWLLKEGHCMRNQVLNMCHQQKSGSHDGHFEYNTGSIETLKRMVDTNNGLTILPELCLSDLSAQQMERVRYFVSPEPTREISIVTHRDFLKQRLIKTLETEIMATIPEHMHHAKKKKVMPISLN